MGSVKGKGGSRSRFGFCATQKESLSTIQFLDWFKQFGLAQNILEPLEEQGIRVCTSKPQMAQDLEDLTKDQKDSNKDQKDLTIDQ